MEKDIIVYLDHASTTCLDERVLDKMLPYLKNIYGNANSLHSIGRLAIKGLDEARSIIAEIIGADFKEVYFTSGGTESDNWAIKGLAKTRGVKNKLVLSSIEHSAMLQTANTLDSDIEVVKVKPDKNGLLSPNDYNKVVDKNTFLTCMMYANNEVGTIQPIKETAKIAHNNNSYFFTDAVQAMGAFDIKVKDLGVDLLSFSAHKFNGPKGVGALYVKNGTDIKGLVTGGHQERSLRGGTSNVAGAVGMAYALKYNRESLERDNKYVQSLRDDFISKVLSQIKCAKLNGDIDNRLYNNANILFSGVSAEALLCQLDLNGVCCSLGAACSAGSIEPSHVLTQMGLTAEEAKSSLRFTFGKSNTTKDVDYVVALLKKLTDK